MEKREVGMAPTRSRSIVLARRPDGPLTPADFRTVESDLPDLEKEQVLVSNLYMSLDPYMRLPLSSWPGTHGQTAIGSKLSGAAVGVVERSNASGFRVGDIVFSQTMGWQDAYVADAASLERLDPSQGLASHRLGILGLTGVTAYAAVELVLQPKPGEVVFVTGAAGAVGSVACQLAKARGCVVAGSAGSAEKLDWLKQDLGVDEVMDYRHGDIGEALRRAFPDGIDAAVDGVGGATLDAILSAMKPFGRIALVGAIGQYETPNYRVGPADFFAVIEKSLLLHGVRAGHYADRAPGIIADLAARLERGELVARETVIEGFASIVGGFIDMLNGANTGKMIVKLRDL